MLMLDYTLVASLCVFILYLFLLDELYNVIFFCFFFSFLFGIFYGDDGSVFLINWIWIYKM